MEITDVRTWAAREKRGKIVGTASVTFDGKLVVRDLKILEGDEGLWVGFPSRKNKEGSERPYTDIVFCLDRDFRAEISAAVLEKFEKSGGALGPEEGEG